MLKDKRIIIAIIIIIIALLVGGLAYSSMKNTTFDYTPLLENQNYDIVYTKSNPNSDNVPYININNEQISKINEEIESTYQYYLIFSPHGFKYDFNVSGNILSLLITAHVIHPENSQDNIMYRSYNIDLRNLKLLNNSDILKLYKITDEQMDFYLYNKFLNYYNDLIEKGYFTEKEYDFNTFLDNKNIYDLLEDNYYYINNSHLELYKYFNIYSDYNEEKYFDESSFHFIVT